MSFTMQIHLTQFQYPLLHQAHSNTYKMSCDNTTGARFVSLIGWTGPTCKRFEDSPLRIRDGRLPLEEHRTSKSTVETMLGERCSVEGTTLKTNRSEVEHGASASQVAAALFLDYFESLLAWPVKRVRQFLRLLK